MTSSLSLALLVLFVVAGTIQLAASETTQGTVVHDGKCPSHNLLIHIHCRRRVCLPQEMIPLCNDDSVCPSTHKCCRPMCSCRDRCVEAIPAGAQE